MTDRMNPTTPRPADAAELMACPFCGGEAYHAKEERAGYDDFPDDPDRWAYVVRCRACAAQGGWSKSSPEGAAHWWNRRSTHPTLARVIAIGQAWVAAEAAVLGRGAGIEMTVRTLPGAGSVASWYDRVDGEGDRLPSEPTPEAALLALAAALTDQERGS